MLSRSNLLLVALLVVQLILLAISVVTSSGTEARPVEKLIAGMTAADIDELSFTDDLENEVTFARGADGWVLLAPRFPRRRRKGGRDSREDRRLDTRRLVATNRANFARLEVEEEEFRRKVSLESGDDSLLLYLGGSGGVDTVYARRASVDKVYLGVGLNAWELSTQISSWLDASYVEVPQDDILEIVVDNAEAASPSFALATA